METYYIVIFATSLNVLGVIPYIKGTLLGKTKPNKVTWGIWALAPLISTVAAISSVGFIWSLFPVFIAGMIPLSVFLVSFINKESYWELKKLDYICLAFSLLALVFWYITSNPLCAIIFSIGADFIASIPLFIKVYKYPETEEIITYYAGFISAASSFLVIQNWVLIEYLFPIYLVLLITTVIFLYHGKRIFKIKI